MKAIVQDRYGSADVLHFEDIATPHIGDDDVLVHVVAAGVDRGAWHWMTGQPYLMRVLGFGFRAPTSRVPGTNIAGRVEAVGRNVTRFHVGDEVYGTCKGGAFAEYARAHQDKLAPKPTRFSFEQAAVTPYAGFVAWQAIHDHGHLHEGESVLVVGASGAVGTIAVQLAVAMGATVTGVCGGTHTELVRSLGAVEVVDYRAEDFAEGTRRFDLILDIGGRTPVRRLRRALAPKGTLVIMGGEGDRWVGGLQRQLWASVQSAFAAQNLATFVAKENATELHRLNELIAAGKVAPILGPTFPLRDGAKAIAAFETGQAQGRIVISP
jgi:NADPH:quinone reductase-like Zn-dependent oxidoreductase